MGLKRAGREWVRARKLYGKWTVRFSRPYLLCVAEQQKTRHWTCEEKRGIDLQKLLAPKSLIHAFITSHFPSTQMSYEPTLHLVPSATLLAHCIKKFSPLGIQFSTHLSWAARNATMIFLRYHQYLATVTSNFGDIFKILLWPSEGQSEKSMTRIVSVTRKAISVKQRPIRPREP